MGQLPPPSGVPLEDMRQLSPPRFPAQLGGPQLCPLQPDHLCKLCTYMKFVCVNCWINEFVSTARACYCDVVFGVFVVVVVLRVVFSVVVIINCVIWALVCVSLYMRDETYCNSMLLWYVHVLLVNGCVVCACVCCCVCWGLAGVIPPLGEVITQQACNCILMEPFPPSVFKALMNVSKSII